MVFYFFSFKTGVDLDLAAWEAAALTEMNPMTLPSLTITLLTTSCGGNVPRSHTRRLQTWLLASGWRAAPLGTHADDLRPGYAVFFVF